MCAATTLLLLVGVAVGREPPLAQQWFSQNSISLVDRAQAGPPARNQRRFAEAIMNTSSEIEIEIEIEFGRVK